jgi:hypothetical protein
MNDLTGIILSLFGRERVSVAPSPVAVVGEGPDGQPIPFAVGADGGLVSSVPGINIPAYDYVLLDPPAKPTTITYKTGGAGGTTVATLTLTYVGDDVESVTRS